MHGFDWLTFCSLLKRKIQVEKCVELAFSEEKLCIIWESGINLFLELLISDVETIGYIKDTYKFDDYEMNHWSNVSGDMMFCHLCYRLGVFVWRRAPAP